MNDPFKALLDTVQVSQIQIPPEVENRIREHFKEMIIKRGFTITPPLFFIANHSPELYAQYCEKYEAYKCRRPGIALFGDNGTGKSFAAQYLATVFLQIKIIDCVEVVERWKDNNQYFKILFEDTMMQDIILDDLGAGQEEKFYGQQCPFNSFLHRRHLLWKTRGIMTHVTTHLTEEEFEVFFDFKNLHRVAEMCYVSPRFEEVVRRVAGRA